MTPKSLKKRISTAAEPQGHTHKAYTGIRRMLFHSEIVPGQKIAYRDLAERLGMSQTPVIQALKWLEFQGLVRHERHRGYYTEPIRIEEVAEIYELREMIEISLLKKSMRILDAKGIDQLIQARRDHAKAAREVYLYDRLVKDMDFHLILASLADNRVQLQVLHNLFDLLYLKYGGNILFSTSLDQAQDDHRLLLDHILQNDYKSARKVLKQHIQRVKKHVLQGLKKMLQEKRASRI